MHFPRSIAILLVLTVSTAFGDQQSARPIRLYEGVATLINNPEGKDFTVTVDVRDINHLTTGAAEILVKIYDPDGRTVVREVIPDDGVTEPSYRSPVASWDHEAWYFATCYSRGIIPAVRWSAFSDPKRVALMAKRTFTYDIKGGQKGVYRVLLLGTPDHYVSLSTAPDLPQGRIGSVDWLHGSGDMYRKSYLHVPRGAEAATVIFFQMDQPADRSFVLKDPAGKVVAEGHAEDGMAWETVKFEKTGQWDDKTFTIEVSAGKDDFLVHAGFLMHEETPIWRTNSHVNAVFAPDEKTSKALQGGAIYHDGKTFWHMFQVRYHDWLKTVKPEDMVLPDKLPTGNDYITSASNHTPKKEQADVIMHDYRHHKNRKALMAALKEMDVGLNLFAANDKITSGPLRNMAYEMGGYSSFYQRPSWRILQQSDAPEAAKSPIMEYMIAYGDRLAFCRAMARVNGNAFTSLVAGLRYTVEATQDPLHKKLFDSYWERFTTGGFGDRIGLGPSGGVQESFGYDSHYGGYMLKGWRAVIADIKDPRILAVYTRVLNLYSYVWGPNPWNSRVAQSVTGGAYQKSIELLPGYDQTWRGDDGPDFTVGVNDHNEWYAAKRQGYYMLTYHGRLTPTWMGEGMYGQVGFGGGVICQLHIPGKGRVLASTLHNKYGKGMGLGNWRNFHIHSVVGETADGRPMVAANSEHLNAKLEGNVVTSSGEVRQSSVRIFRKYTFEDAAIACELQLGQSAANKVFHIWAHRPKPREFVTEAYEMIPYWRPAKRSKDAPAVVTGSAEPGGAPTALDKENAVPVRTVTIAREDYGVRIVFDEPQKVKLGADHTILVQLIEGKTLPGDIALKYRLVPFGHEPAKQP